MPFYLFQQKYPKKFNSEVSKFSSEKGQIRNIFDFVGHIWSVTCFKNNNQTHTHTPI